MGAAAAGAGFEILVKVIGMIGDRKAWNLHVRMWAHDWIQKAAVVDLDGHPPVPDFAAIERLEAWVHEAARYLEVFGRERREALRMWAYEQAGGDYTHAIQLYTWAVQGEGGGEVEVAPSPGRGPGGFADEPRHATRRARARSRLRIQKPPRKGGRR
jgi:hypothetical protein